MASIINMLPIIHAKKASRMKRRSSRTHVVKFAVQPENKVRYVCMYVCIYIYIYVCMCTHYLMHSYTHTLTHRHENGNDVNVPVDDNKLKPARRLTVVESIKKGK